MSEKRQLPRNLVTWRVAIILPNSPQPIQGKTQEVSTCGAGIFLVKNLPLKTRCTLIFEVPNANHLSRHYVEVQAVVLHSCLVGNISEYRTGFQFTQECAQFKQLFSEKELVRARTTPEPSSLELPPLDDFPEPPASSV